MTSRDEHPTWRYEREAEATRHRLAHSLDELSDRLTPGQVMDEMLTYAKGGGGTFFRTFSNATRANPIPSLLIGAGCMMFLSEKMGLNRYVAGQMTDGNGARGNGASDASSGIAAATGRAADAAASGVRSATDSVRSGVRSAADFAGDQAAGVADGVKKGAAAVGETVSSATQSVTETAHDLRDQASATAEQVKRGAQQLGEAAQEYSAAMKDTVTDAAGRARQQTVTGARQAKDTVVSFVQEQPLLCAAVGLAFGAALAAMLPSTEAENELMGETSDAVKGAVGEVASEQLDTAKAAATRIAGEAMGVAEREGLTPAAAVGAAKQLGEKIKTVVSETGSASKSEAGAMAGVGQKGPYD